MRGMASLSGTAITRSAAPALLVLALLSGAGADGSELALERVRTGLEFAEGPVWSARHGLWFTDVPGDAILRADGSTVRRPSGRANGLALDPSGRLIACEQGRRRVTRTERDGRITVLAERYRGKRLNSPNDCTVARDGTVYFTDPPYGLRGREAELTFRGVYAVSPSGELHLLTDAFDRPNGIALAPDGATLYVGDSRHGFIDAFAIRRRGELTERRRFCDVPTPDGMETDADGRLWVAAADGARLYSAAGNHLRTVRLPELPATNCALGAGGARLYVTTPTSVWEVRLDEIPENKPETTEK